MLRYGALIAAVFVAFPANAQQMNAAEARSFVVGKLFNYVCFEGTRGAGRINDNGSVGGTIQFRGNGSTRYAVLPQNTIRVVGDKVCASVKGVPFEPCFTPDQDQRQQLPRFGQRTWFRLLRFRAPRSSDDCSGRSAVSN